jgi:acyl-coenzyme A thioesterase PaaI-like protein
MHPPRPPPAWLLTLAITLKIPLMLFMRPRVDSLDDEGSAIRIPLGWRTRNHVGSMHIGVLATGADLAVGVPALRAIRAGHAGVVLIFADLRAEFLKRADGDVVFRCRDGRRIAAAVAQADASGERVTIPVEVVATVPARYGDEPVARFVLGLSLRRRSEKVAAPPAAA